MPGKETGRDAALRREAYAQYAKAVVCADLGMLPEAMRLTSEALRLCRDLVMPNGEDMQLRTEIEALAESVKRMNKG